MTASGTTSAPQHHLLVVDDESTQRDMLASILGRAGYAVTVAAGGEQALAEVEQRTFDAVLSDQRMAGMDGLALLDAIHSRSPLLPVVLMTAYGSVGAAVEAMKRGAADYLCKPFDRDELLLVLAKVLRQRELEQELQTLRGVLADRYSLGNIVGSSAAMQEVFSLVERIARTDVPVLIQGESGTGKEMVARAVHENGPRKKRPFVAVNCAAIPENLLESEFFGHERGAFTGAVQARAGSFEQADGGTLLLDEIGAMRIDLQAKLLRAIQEREVQRVGGTGPRKVDVRLLAATCDDLEESMRRKTFREDLYYRLSVVPIRLPSLRERIDDIPALVDRFLVDAARRFGRAPLGISPEAVDRMQTYPWPGNVRELQNCVERMVVLARSNQLTLNDLPSQVRQGVQASGDAEGAFRLPATGVRLPEVERDLIRQALARTRGSIAPAARLLGISYKTLQYRIQKYALDREAEADSSEG